MRAHTAPASLGLCWHRWVRGSGLALGLCGCGSSQGSGGGGSQTSLFSMGGTSKPRPGLFQVVGACPGSRRSPPGQQAPGDAGSRRSGGVLFLRKRADRCGLHGASFCPRCGGDGRGLSCEADTVLRDRSRHRSSERLCPSWEGTWPSSTHKPTFPGSSEPEQSGRPHRLLPPPARLTCASGVPACFLTSLVRRPYEAGRPIPFTWGKLWVTDAKNSPREIMPLLGAG